MLERKLEMNMSDAKTVKRLASVDGYIRKNSAWSAELEALREMVLESGLTEEVKWRCPCYTLGGKLVAFVGAFKESCVLSFVKGALLKDPKGVLEKQGAESQSVRVMRFKGVAEVERRRGVIQAYLKEAIANEKAGLKVEKIKIEDRAVPEEFEKKMNEMPKLREAFEKLTPGRRRMYLLHFGGAKQAKTREARVEKYVEQILEGRGMED